MSLFDSFPKGNSKDVFIATHGTTTYAEVKAACDAGKVVLCTDGTNVLMLERKDSVSFEFSCSIDGGGLCTRVAYDNTWNPIYIDLFAGVTHAREHWTDGEDPLSPEGIGAADKVHTHNPSTDLDSAVPVSKGGTGATTAEQALANLGGIAVGAVGNLHVWERVQTYSEEVPEVPAGYTLGEIETNVYISSLTSGNVGIRYGDSVTVSNDGTVSISNSSDTNNSVSDWGYSAQYGKLNGKFCTVYYENGSYVTKEVFFYPSGAYLRSDSNGLYATELQRVTGYPYTPAIPAGTTTDYLTSTDRNAYPDQSAEGGQDAYYTLGDAITNTRPIASSNSVTFAYADAPVVSPSGVVSVPSTNTASISYSSLSNTDLLVGKFIQAQTSNSAGFKTDVYFIPDSASFYLSKVDGSNYVHVTKAQPVTGHAAIPANTTITYLGQLGEPGAKIEVGSYVGTGTYGSSNPNSLTFGFEPKMVYVHKVPKSSNDYYNNGLYLFYGVTMDITTTYGAIENNIAWNNTSVSWYSSDSAEGQMNKSETTYYYIAID